MIVVSVVVATYNRPKPLVRLLETLAQQTLPRDEYEVVVVDDGSEEDARPLVQAMTDRLQVQAIRQKNGGVAVARQRGVEEARGRVVIFLDDDMLVAEDFVEEHVRLHDGYDDRVVMGELLPDTGIAEMPLFERYHAYQLRKVADGYAASGTFAGHAVYTGNLSLTRDLFFRAGGFDPAFHIEDVELGVRLEQEGASFIFSRSVATVHASDHTSLDSWLARSVKDGADWVRLVRKHPRVRDANPWRFMKTANPIAKPFFVAAVVAPQAGPRLARLAFDGARGAAALGFERATVQAMTLVYGIQYFVGVRRETGTLREALDSYRAYRRADDAESA